MQSRDFPSRSILPFHMVVQPPPKGTLECHILVLQYTLPDGTTHVFSRADLGTFHDVSIHLEGFETIPMSQPLEAIFTHSHPFWFILRSLAELLRCFSMRFGPKCDYMCFRASQQELKRIGLNDFTAFYERIKNCYGSFLFVLSVSMFVDPNWCVVMRPKRFLKAFKRFAAM